MLPEIPAALEPAPHPRLTDTAEMSTEALRRWQDGLGARLQFLFGAGPHSCADDQGVMINFPTFGQSAQQTYWLTAGGYRWTGRGWFKRVNTEDVTEELRWARRLYAVLHPSWRPHA